MSAIYEAQSRIWENELLPVIAGRYPTISILNLVSTTHYKLLVVMLYLTLNGHLSTSKFECFAFWKDLIPPTWLQTLWLKLEDTVLKIDPLNQVAMNGMCHAHSFSGGMLLHSLVQLKFSWKEQYALCPNSNPIFISNWTKSNDLFNCLDVCLLVWICLLIEPWEYVHSSFK